MNETGHLLLFTFRLLTIPDYRLEDGSNHSKWLRRKMEADRERRRAEEEEKMKQKQVGKGERKGRRRME